MSIMNARPTDRLAIAVAQLDPTVGDIPGNAAKARAARAAAARAGADLGAFPPLFLSGSPPPPLALNPPRQPPSPSMTEALPPETPTPAPAPRIATPSKQPSPRSH